MERSQISAIHTKLWNFSCRSLNGLIRLYKLSLEVEEAISFIESKLATTDEELKVQRRHFKKCQESLNSWIQYPRHKGFHYVGFDAAHDFSNILRSFDRAADKQNIWKKEH